MFTGMIALWSGSVASIPTGWQLCNGTNGTPDLRDRFVQGAGGALNPGDVGGATTHTHTFTSDPHTHNIGAGGAVQAGAALNNVTDSAMATGINSAQSNYPPYYALAYIMFL